MPFIHCNIVFILVINKSVVSTSYAHFRYSRLDCIEDRGNRLAREYMYLPSGASI